MRVEQAKKIDQINISLNLLGIAGKRRLEVEQVLATRMDLSYPEAGLPDLSTLSSQGLEPGQTDLTTQERRVFGSTESTQGSTRNLIAQRRSYGTE